MAASSCYVAMSALVYSITLIFLGNLRETKLSACYRHIGISHVNVLFQQSLAAFLSLVAAAICKLMVWDLYCLYSEQSESVLQLC